MTNGIMITGVAREDALWFGMEVGAGLVKEASCDFLHGRNFKINQNSEGSVTTPVFDYPISRS